MQSVVRLQRQQALVRSVIAKEKKTRGHGGCFLSYEIGIQLQKSKEKESDTWGNHRVRVGGEQLVDRGRWGRGDVGGGLGQKKSPVL